ncbi:MAG TPA: hypothetical protein QGF95_02995 [Candidatus Latescibacteria bacterium]|nr:hypothetical protein [Candidatus Latescibacterota bacterium]HJP29503.1 hypothetical protein [Candidatus Latescibacterota bacterium]
MSTVYTLFWFDVEDYLTPESDDALKGLLEVFEACGVQATWKMVAEKARVLEERGRSDIIRLLQRQDIGYHTDNHSQHPVLAEYLADAGWEDGVEEVIRRERPGYDDVTRILGPSSTFGQAGGSWAPQLYPFLRDAGVPLFMDEASHVGCDGEPFWFCGVLHVNRMEDAVTRCAFDRGDAGLAEGIGRFNEIHQRQMTDGGGLVSIYYHPCEWATTAFWDGVNFGRGAMPPRHEWRPAPRRPPGEMAAGLDVFRRYVEHIVARPGVEVITGRQLINLFPDDAHGAAVNAADLAQALEFESGAIDVTWLGDVALSPSEIFALVCDTLMEAVYTLSEGIDVDTDSLAAIMATLHDTPYGPTRRVAPTLSAGGSVPSEAFIEATADARQFLHYHGRVPAAVWVGARCLCPADFLVTAADLLRRLVLDGGGLPTQVTVRAGSITGERHIREQSWGWAVFAEDFEAPGILEQARLQTWTLKPATRVD